MGLITLNSKDFKNVFVSKKKYAVTDFCWQVKSVLHKRARKVWENAGFVKDEWESNSGNSCKHGRVFVVKNMGSQLYGRFIQLTKRWPVDDTRLGR